MSRALQLLEATVKPATPPVPSSSSSLNIGEILRRSGVVAQAEIDDALAVMASHEMRLGQALVAIGACTVDDVPRTRPPTPPRRVDDGMPVCSRRDHRRRLRRNRPGLRMPG
jgi:hypothetical protein